MTEKEIRERYIRLAFYYESAIDALLAKGVIDANLATATKKKFYNPLDREKIRASSKVRHYRKTIRLYMRQMTCKKWCHQRNWQSNTLKNLLDMAFKAGCATATHWNFSANGKMT